jgi:hypothetical protein
LHVDRFFKNESDGTRLYGVMLEDETCRDLENAGDGRAKTPNRWERSQYAQLLVSYKEQHLHFIAFTRKAARICARGDYGLGRHKFIRDAAIRHLEIMGELPNPKAPEVFNVIWTNRIRKSPGRHTVRPKVMERR